MGCLGLTLPEGVSEGSWLAGVASELKETCSRPSKDLQLMKSSCGEGTWRCDGGKVQKSGSLKTGVWVLRKTVITLGSVYTGHPGCRVMVFTNWGTCWWFPHSAEPETG